MCYGNAAKSLEIARSRLTPEQWAKFERDFNDFCVVQGLRKPIQHLSGHLLTHQDVLIESNYDWARWAFFQGRQHSWISVENRMPEHNQLVLVAFADGGIDFSYRFERRGVLQWSSVDLMYHDQPTHWMMPPTTPADSAVADAYFEKIAIAMMSDEQAVASLERWKEGR